MKVRAKHERRETASLGRVGVMDIFMCGKWWIVSKRERGSDDDMCMKVNKGIQRKEGRKKDGKCEKEGRKSNAVRRVFLCLFFYFLRQAQLQSFYRGTLTGGSLIKQTLPIQPFLPLLFQPQTTKGFIRSRYSRRLCSKDGLFCIITAHR